MILRRLSQSLKEQNWVAIWLEFVLLVVGVFLGIEVANWNDARRDREAEAIYLDRLDREIRQILPEVDSSRDEVVETLARIDQVWDFLDTGMGAQALGGKHCAALATSHIFADTIFYPTTIKELIATGRIVLIRDNAIRTAILSFDQTNAEMSQLRTDIQIDRRLLARTYPELINIGFAEWEDATCDFPAMARNPAFRNDFTDNMHRYRAYAFQVKARQSETLTSLGAAVTLRGKVP